MYRAYLVIHVGPELYATPADHATGWCDSFDAISTWGTHKASRLILHGSWSEYTCSAGGRPAQIFADECWVCHF